MAGYNPYRKENGEFASKGELGGVESKVEADLTAARSADDSERADEIERYAMDRLPESKLGKSLLEARYGAAPAPTAPKPSVSTEERYEGLRAELSTAGNAGSMLAAREGRKALGIKLEGLSDEELTQLSARSSDQLNAGRPGLVWDRDIGSAVAIEQRRRTHSESFDTLTELGYEHDGLGHYGKPGNEGVSFLVTSAGRLGVIARGEKLRVIHSEDELRDAATGEPKLSSARIPQNIAASLEAAGVKRPMNWDEMGSSAKDRWEEAQYRALNR